MRYILGLDLETTGLDVLNGNRIIEYCGLAFSPTMDFLAAQSMTQRINPQRESEPGAFAVHKIKLSELMDKPVWEEVAGKIHEQIKNASLVVIHNASFDANFLTQEFRRVGLADLKTPTYCTMRANRWATFDGKIPSLRELCGSLDVEYDTTSAHAAEYDVTVMMECFKKTMLSKMVDKKYILPFSEVTETNYFKAENLAI